jgi:hypothetical protein
LRDPRNYRSIVGVTHAYGACWTRSSPGVRDDGLNPTDGVHPQSCAKVGVLARIDAPQPAGVLFVGVSMQPSPRTRVKADPRVRRRTSPAKPTLVVARAGNMLRRALRKAAKLREAARPSSITKVQDQRRVKAVYATGPKAVSGFLPTHASRGKEERRRETEREREREKKTSLSCARRRRALMWRAWLLRSNCFEMQQATPRVRLQRCRSACTPERSHVDHLAGDHAAVVHLAFMQLSPSQPASAKRRQGLAIGV